MRWPGRSPGASVTLPFIPRSVPSGLRGHGHPSARGSGVFLLSGFEPVASSPGVRCMTPELRDLPFVVLPEEPKHPPPYPLPNPEVLGLL